jgi:hypothetical protein
MRFDRRPGDAAIQDEIAVQVTQAPSSLDPEAKDA